MQQRQIQRFEHLKARTSSTEHATPILVNATKHASSTTGDAAPFLMRTERQVAVGTICVAPHPPNFLQFPKGHCLFLSPVQIHPTAVTNHGGSNATC